MPRMTLQVRLVLQALAEDPGRERYGLEIVDWTGLMPGTIYPILARLEQAGWLSSEWETVDESAAGRPRRRYYRLTPDGLTAAAAAATTAPRAATRLRPSLGRILPGEAWS
ncbi:PadR family transcriptional regulator [Actinoplanes sp. NPDC024001]|uniref:PadR family transcriptional regulator n=1 Tax=Actinoplanes sp. NPDC024001 TaxID=3154598 RepID=UPI0033FB6B99